MYPSDGAVVTIILALMYFGDVVFAVSGGLAAGRRRLGIVGYLMVGVVTGIGGGTLRDLLLGRVVWWTRDPAELTLCIVAALAPFFWSSQRIKNKILKLLFDVLGLAASSFVAGRIAFKLGAPLAACVVAGLIVAAGLCVAAALEPYFRTRPILGVMGLMDWFDALGLASFAVVGAGVSIAWGAPFIVCVFMGMLTATGGGVIRDLLTGMRPMILRGQVYALAALTGALVFTGLKYFSFSVNVAATAGFLAAFCVRGAAMIFDIRMGPPGEYIIIGRGKAEEQGGAGARRFGGKEQNWGNS